MTISTALAILQQSEYHWQYFLDWYQGHAHDSLVVEPKQWTTKLKLIRNIAGVLFFIPLLTRLKIALRIAVIIETPIRLYTEHQAKNKLRQLKKKGLIVVGIAGSYAKTSTKHILNHAFSGTQTVFMTPASVNTPLGIAQVILNQLTAQHTLFIAELGEYYQGDIMALAKFVEPDFGIITPVGHQHLERMGSLENIAKTVGELADYFKIDHSKVLISDANRKFFSADYAYYGEKNNSTYSITNIDVSTRGTEFVIIKKTDDAQWPAFMPLFGAHQAINTLPSVWLAEKLGVDPKMVIKKLSTLPFIPRRHEPKFSQHNILILDNSYNTNPESMAASLELITQLPAEQRTIITMGYVELGKDSDEIHYQLGKKLADTVDLVGLVTSRANRNLKKGFLENGGQAENVVEAADPEKAFALLSDRIKPNSIVLFEGGYQELFS